MYNFLPSISAAIGGFTPQRYVWRICIALQVGLRFLLVGCYYYWLSGINMGEHKAIYQKLVKVAIGCHIVENLALLTLTCVSSTENFSKSCCSNFMSRVVRKPAFCICENKDADQLRGNREADQRLCFRYSDCTIPLLPTSEISSL